MGWADKVRKLGVRANADTPNDARVALKFGAEGIGLCRTEHMFFDEERIRAVREMILADDEKSRRAALAKLLPDAARGFRRAVRDHAGAAGHDPAARPSAARVPAAQRRGDRRGRRRHEGRPEEAGGARPRAARVQSDARLPRLSPGARLSRDRRDAGARHLRGGGRSRQAHRQAGRAGGDGAAHRHQDRARPRQGAHRRHGRGGRARDRDQGQLPGRHHDRAAAGVAARRRDRRERRVLLLRHQRPDPDHLTASAATTRRAFSASTCRAELSRAIRSSPSTARAWAN